MIIKTPSGRCGRAEEMLSEKTRAASAWPTLAASTQRGYYLSGEEGRVIKIKGSRIFGIGDRGPVARRRPDVERFD
jgi:hypothetical protein